MLATRPHRRAGTAAASKQAKAKQPDTVRCTPTDTLARPISFSRSLSETPSCVTLERGAIVRGAHRMHACTIRMHARMIYDLCMYACRYACMYACLHAYRCACRRVKKYRSINAQRRLERDRTIGRNSSSGPLDRPSRPAVWQHVDSAVLHHVARGCNVSCGVATGHAPIKTTISRNLSSGPIFESRSSFSTVACAPCTCSERSDATGKIGAEKTASLRRAEQQTF